MSARLRFTKKVGKNFYVSDSINLNGNFITKFFKFIILLYYYFFKYVFYVPIKWIIDKIKNISTNSNK